MTDGFQYYREQFYEDFQAAISKYPDAAGGNLMPTREQGYEYYHHFASCREDQHFGRVVNASLNIRNGFDLDRYKELEPAGQAFNPTTNMNGMRRHQDQFKFAWLKKHG